MNDTQYREYWDVDKLAIDKSPKVMCLLTCGVYSSTQQLLLLFMDSYKDEGKLKLGLEKYSWNRSTWRLRHKDLELQHSRAYIIHKLCSLPPPPPKKKPETWTHQGIGFSSISKLSNRLVMSYLLVMSCLQCFVLVLWWTCCVDQSDLELDDPPFFASKVLCYHAWLSNWFMK